MPFTVEQIRRGGISQLDHWLKGEAFDQVNPERPFLKWLLQNKRVLPAGNSGTGVPLHISNDSNAQNYFGADRVTYNERNTLKDAHYMWANKHDGFGIDEDRLLANGIHLTDDSTVMPTKAESLQIVNLFGEQMRALKEGLEDSLEREFLLDGSQSPDAVAGLDALVAVNPATGIVGGIDAGTNTFWRSNVSLGVLSTTGILLAEMEKVLRATTLYSKSRPDVIFMGGKAYDAYMKEVRTNHELTVNVGANGAGNLDGGTASLSFKGIPIIWVPQLDILEAETGPNAEPYDKRIYMLNSKSLFMSPLEGEWMRKRNPDRMYDQYVHYFGITCKYKMITTQRNAHALITID